MFLQHCRVTALSTLLFLLSAELHCEVLKKRDTFLSLNCCLSPVCLVTKEWGDWGKGGTESVGGQGNWGEGRLEGVTQGGRQERKALGMEGGRK